MTNLCNGNNYSSQKFPLLEFIFDKYNPTHDTKILNITFTLADISEAYDALEIFKVDGNGKRRKIKKPTSTSNTILDLVRKSRPITSRLPSSIIELGYDLRKKTGHEVNTTNYAGEFVFVGIGKSISSWLVWPEGIEVLELSSKSIPDYVRPHIRPDEGGLFSVIDYCDVLSYALNNKESTVFRVQHPLKWQPNEIDGFYMGMEKDVVTLYPVEAKSLATEDDVNLDQILGAHQTVSKNFEHVHAHIIPLAAQMIKNGILIAIFDKFEIGERPDKVTLKKAIKVIFYPPITTW